MHKLLRSSARSVHSSSQVPLTLGIRREDPQRIWERRAPLTPDDVHHLISKKNVEIHIQPCDRRVYPISEYLKAGAKVSQTLDQAHILLGIKETPLDELLTTPIQRPSKSHGLPFICPRTHLMFSHTVKGQSYNTPLLGRFVASRFDGSDASFPRLIDYELLTRESDGKRAVGFGWFAGVAGVLESLSAMAHAHLEIGIASPFLYTPRPHTQPSLERLRTSLREIGTWIANDGTPPKLGPFVIGLTGTGKVADGCLSMLSELPIQKVEVKDLDALVRNPETSLHKIYLVHAKPADYLVSLDGRPYNREHYYQSPHSYISTFAEKIAPYLTHFLNGTGWSPSFPRLMTNRQLGVALQRAQGLGVGRFTSIGDISCDVEGGLEFLTKATTLSSPSYKTRPENLPHHLPSVQIMSVDILPSAIPLDASEHFSKALLPYVESLIEKYTTNTADRYTGALERATIASEGQLTEKHAWLRQAVDDWYAKKDKQPTGVTKKAPSLLPARKKKILMFGSGMVAGPAIDTIAARGDIQLMIASDSMIEVQKLVEDHINVQYLPVDVNDQQACAQLIAQADVVVSLLPVNFHPVIAKLCIHHKKHLVTASYISPAMQALNESAIQADVVLLNEIGLDPGIDHCSAIELLSRLRQTGRHIVSFTSFCGGLPAPEVFPVPLRYKFSWRPAGVLAAALNSASFRLNDKNMIIKQENLLKDHFEDIPITDLFKLEGIANRDSLAYASTYDLHDVRTLLRGTLRYPGFSDLMDSFRRIGLLEQNVKLVLEDWSTFIRQAIMSKLGVSAKRESFGPILRELVGEQKIGPLVEALEWFGLLQSRHPYIHDPMPPLPAGPLTSLDIFAYLLSHKLRYEPGERDMVVLSHEIIAQPSGAKGVGFPEEVYKSTLITYGTPKASAMARTVGIPVATAALAVADGKVPLRGVIGPTDSSIYKPILSGLEEVGLGMAESQMRTGSSLESVLINEAQRKHLGKETPAGQ